MTPRLAARLPLFIAAALAAGCAVGPDFQRPAAPASSGYGEDPPATPTASGRPVPADWWRQFRSEALSHLVEDALAHNPDLAAAQAALHVARENSAAGWAMFLPSIEGNFAPSRQKNAGTLSPTLAQPNMPIFDLYTAQVQVSYTLDIFGGNRRQKESLEAQAEQQRFMAEATYQTLAANVAVGAFQEAALRAQLSATEDMARVGRDILDITRRRATSGDASGADLAAQEAALAQVEAALPALKKQLQQQDHQLIALAGRLPDDAAGPRFDLDGFSLPSDLPFSLPSRLVEQRPDIRAAEANLHAATAQVGVAIAGMLPQITLDGNIGSIATEADQLFKAGNGFWAIGGGLAQPIFEGGALLHKTAAARAALEQAAAQYRSTVIAAFQNVADVLAALRQDADAAAASVRAEAAAAQSLAIARRQFALGDAAYLSVLNAEATHQQAVVARIQAQSVQLADVVALFQALGGGWWNRAGDDKQDGAGVAGS